MPPAKLPPTDCQVEIDFAVDDAIEAVWDEPTMHQLVTSIVCAERPPARYTLSLHLVTDESIRTLNREHRGLDAPTDVLSFPLEEASAEAFALPPGEPLHLGDVVVSYPRAMEQAEAFGHAPERELAYLVAHGVLHVLGFDHEQEDEQRAMRAREERALAPLGLTR